jgi:hypothetical protein
VEVAESALVRASAKRETAEDREVWFAVPGLLLMFEVRIYANKSTGDSISYSLEIVQSNSEALATSEVIKEGIIGLLSLCFLFLGQVYEV